MAKGCLVVNWDKEKGESGKTPNFRLLWTFAVGNKGFAVYLSGNFDDTYVDNPKMSLGGIAYLFNKNREGNWEPTEQLTSKNEPLLKNNIRVYLPQHTVHVLPNAAAHNTHWNFLETGKEQIKIDGQTTPFRKYWHWKQNKGSKDNVMSWSLNLPIWWFHFFDTQKWDMPGALEHVEKGEWVEGVEEVVQAKPAQ